MASFLRTLAAAMLVLATGCGSPEPQHGGPGPLPSLGDLGSVPDFQARFDADSAFPRLVLLLSPT